MQNEEPQRAPFDQQAALEELERFGREIERYREQRKAVGERFERFIQSFETPAAAPPIGTSGPAAAPVAPAPPADDPVPINALDMFPDVKAPVPSDTPRSTEVPSAPDREFAPPIFTDNEPEPRAVIAAPAALEPRPTPAPRTSPAVSTPVLVGGALVVILAGGMLARTLWNRAPESTPPVTTTPDTSGAAAGPAPAAAPAAPPAAAAAPPAAVAQPSSQSHLTTIRRVWMRVTTDGVRVLEREVPAGTLVPLTAEQSIVIRTGDAGAVRVTIRGEDRGALGAEGEVVTRSFTLPPRRAPADR